MDESGDGGGSGKARRGDVVPSISDHNLSLPEWSRREPEDAESGGGLPGSAGGGLSAGREGDGGVVEGEVERSRAGPERPFPAVLLVAPGCFALLLAATADEVASRNGLSDGAAIVLAAGGGLLGALCFGVLGQRAEGEGGRILGPLAVGISVLVAGGTLMRLV